MLDRLREAHYRRTLGAEEADRIARVERSVDALPPSLATDEWCRWLWSLPPEAWEEAVALRSLPDEILEQRERAVRLITRKNRLERDASGSEEARAAENDVERFKVGLRSLEAEYHEARKRFHGHWGTAPT